MADKLVAALKAAGFKGKALPVAYAIVKRESGGNPRAYNPNRATGDQSYGLSQINMLGRMGADRRRAYGLRSNEDLFDPATNLRVMFAMSKGGRDFGAWGVGPNAYRKTAPLDLSGFPGDAVEADDNMPAAYSSSRPATGKAQGGGQESGAPRQDLRGLALALLSRSRERRGAAPLSPVVQALLSQQPDTPPPEPAQPARAAAEAPAAQPLPSAAVSNEGRDIRELFYDPAGYAFDEGKRIAPIGGHSDHVHASFGTPQAALQAIALAQKLGLRASENPYVDKVDPVHTPTSYHYRKFKSPVGGKPLGEALDVSGAPNLMAAFLAALRKRYGI